MEHNREIFSYVVEVINEQDIKEVCKKLQEGWILLGLFGKDWPTFSLGRVPNNYITVQEDRKNVPTINLK